LKLLFITQEIDPEHPSLAATGAKVAALAARVDEVVVLADAVAAGSLPPNCRGKSFRSRSQLGRGVRFEAALAEELPGLRRGAIVAHMCPIYAVLAAPLARPLGIPVVLWYAHWRRSALLRVAERVATAVVSVEARSFPLPSRKLHAIGHGIDPSEFECRDRAPAEALRVLALGRYSPAKGLDTVVRAVAATDAQLTVHGPALTREERGYRLELERLVDELAVADRVSLCDAVPRAEVPGLFAGADVLVDNMRAGAPDKVVYEAGAACLPVLASNPVFDVLLPPQLRYGRDRPDELEARLRQFDALDAAQRAEVGRALRNEVEQRHAVDGWAEGVLRTAGLA
jgi:glycosyltransferase involved in cell wall biosynthesis